MSRITLILFFIVSVSFSQTKNLGGVVSDDTNKPLESTNVIAKPLQEKASLKFAITDNKGRYKLELENNVKYEITVSYIGFIEEVFILEVGSDKISHDFKLKPSGEDLKEIVIKHEFKPIVVKKDTLVFDVNSFANGNERKMKEILEKLPGVEVDKKGIVTVQGKKVTKMLVEGKSFFGGGSKLAVENIPANALDKIEVIDHFNEVGFMKQVSDSDDLAMNVKLKEDKKKFVFGDIQSGVEAGGGDNGFYLAHAALFYYSPKTNVSFIGDANNVGKSTFTFEDLMRFGGGVSSYLSGRKPLSNLYSFTNDNRDVVQNKSQFAAFNFSHDFSSKFALSGYAILSKVFTASRIESKNEYLNNSSIDFEYKSRNADNKSVLGIGNVKLDYSPSNKEKWYYNGQYQASNNDLMSTLNSVTNLGSNLFETINEADNSSVKQYVEWHKNYNDNHTTTFVINQAYDKITPKNKWFTSEPFLQGLIPLQEDVNYTINQIKKSEVNSIDALFKHYWIINNSNHLYTNVGNNFESSGFKTSEQQILTDGSINDFASAGFGNDINYRLNDAYIGLEYKFRIGKWVNKPGLYLHWYHLKTVQNNIDYVILKTLFQPQWNSDYEFNKSENLSFTYKLQNEFPEANQLANRYTLQYYNSVYKGNALLQNEKYHSANLRYSKMNSYRGITLDGMLTYSKKIKVIRDQVELDGINQFVTPILTENPETNIGFNGSFSKRIYRFNLKLNTRLSWLNYTQTVNDISTINQRNNQNVGLVFKTAYKKWPDFSIGYNKGFSEFSGLTKSKYQTDAITSKFETNFLKFWTFNIEYESLKNTNNANQTNFYDMLNTSLFYQKKNSPLGFELSVNNVLDIKKKNSYSFSNYMISEQATYILPRAILFSVTYKL
ncbi:carboxypeptidase-like regulatory domain-containing protein [Flavobacterium johnsoniae]|uniref:carboxypeptidase-like regulatory domain-containing protein n=1 Tax=Flavobacterium johnsoniae TaxID=986 RepID=UPI0025B0A648|nr:carboxypeptidase-like regulatory domain-containing protein [Flavobacterium johnsoniae]WJS93691.1 carboxypeptidase-like regulatory domain-containing protein [Flavobacterium johnsoniae]